MLPTQDRTQEIRNELALLQHTLKMTVDKAIRVGQLLTEQKAFVGHGNFIAWIEKNLDINERSARRYMALYEYRDKTDKLSDLHTAYQQIETIEAQERQSREERERSIISEYRRTGVKPIGWTPKIEQSVKDTDDNEAKRKAQREKEEAERLQRAKEYQEKQQQKPDHIYTLHSEAFQAAAETLIKQTTERANWKEKIRLSDGGKEDAFMDAIIDYLEGLENDSRRIEACNNLIKICRNIAVELQKNSVRN